MRHQPINDDAVRSSEARTATGPLAGESAELLFELAWYHHREDKPQWWAMFDRAERDAVVEDPDSLGGLVAIGKARPEKQSRVRRMNAS